MTTTPAIHAATDVHYQHAPITEAIIDIQVATTATVDILASVNAGETNYPTANKMQEAAGELIFGPNNQSSARTTAKEVGQLVHSIDKLNVFQARINGFTFSRLAPYPTWIDFSTEARRLWQKYVAITKPTAITRIAVRYVNRIDIPLPLRDFNDYLLTAPQLGPALPQGLSGFFMRLNVPMPEIHADAIINETIVNAARSDLVSVVLDIDVFRAAEVPQSEDLIWDYLEQLRHAKNKIFEGCITNKARELFR